MSYKWKPSASQRKAFAQKMQNPDEKAAYEKRKADRIAKRRANSQFDYPTAGGEYVPTKQQHDAAWRALEYLPLTDAQSCACNMVMSGYTCQMKIHHDYIHIVNELRRTNNIQ